MSENTKKERVYSKDAVILLVASFFYMSTPMLVTPLITGFAAELNASGAIMGIVGGIMNLVSLFCRPIFGNVADRISKSRFASIGFILMVIATLGYVFAPNIAVIMISRIVNGIGFSCCSICMSTWLSDMLPRDKIGSGMGLFGTVGALSMAIAPAIGVSLLGVIGYRPAFLIATGCSLLSLIMIQFIKNKGEPISEMKEKKAKVQLIEPRAFPIALIVMLFAIPYCATQSFLVSYVDARSLAVNVSLFFPLYAVFLMIFRFSFKSKFDKWKFGVFFWSGALCCVIAILGLAFLFNNIILVVASAALAGGYGIMCSVGQSTAILLAGPGKRGVANSTYYVGLDLGLTLGPLLGGFLYGAFPVEFFYPILMVCVPLSVVVYVVWMIILKRKENTAQA